MMCLSCLKACELHNITHCATCHKHEGECDYGACQEPSTTYFTLQAKNGRVIEQRHVCAEHKTLLDKWCN